jgi:hypothetical protein
MPQRNRNELGETIVKKRENNRQGKSTTYILEDMHRVRNQGSQVRICSCHEPGNFPFNQSQQSGVVCPRNHFWYWRGLTQGRPMMLRL